MDDDGDEVADDVAGEDVAHRMWCRSLPVGWPFPSVELRVGNEPTVVVLFESVKVVNQDMVQPAHRLVL